MNNWSAGLAKAGLGLELACQLHLYRQRLTFDILRRELRRNILSFIRREIGTLLGIWGGILGLLSASRILLDNPFAGYFFEYAGWVLAVTISCSAIIGAVLVLKGKLILGGNLMLFTSLIWAFSLPLQYILPLSGMIGIITRMLFTLYFIAGPWPVLSLIGSALILSAYNRSIEVAKVKREQKHEETGFELSSPTNTETQTIMKRNRVLQQAEILISLSTLILILNIIAIGIMWGLTVMA
jgi:hypothetical protein